MILTYDVDEADREAFERVAGEHAAARETYPGCLRFQVGRDIAQTGRYQLIELWQSQQHLHQHGESEAFRRTMTGLAQCKMSQVRPDRYEVS